MVGIVGREPELAAARELIAQGDSPRALVLTGEPGIGKTALWEAAVGAAREEGTHVLAARPSDDEARIRRPGRPLRGHRPRTPRSTAGSAA